MLYLGRDVVLVVVLELVHEVHLRHELLRLAPVRLDAHQDAHRLQRELDHFGGVGEAFHLLDGLLVERGQSFMVERSGGDRDRLGDILSDRRQGIAYL